ncbi:MAG TPA: hypothetical protein VGD71_05665 [Kribbella sp.]
MTLVDNMPSLLAAGFPLVDEDPEHHRFRVHRDAMTSERVFKDELERIFNRCWLYVGHESEVRNPGDYNVLGGQVGQVS